MNPSVREVVTSGPQGVQTRRNPDAAPDRATVGSADATPYTPPNPPKYIRKVADPRSTDAVSQVVAAVGGLEISAEGVARTTSGETGVQIDEDGTIHAPPDSPFWNRLFRLGSLWPRD